MDTDPDDGNEPRTVKTVETSFEILDYLEERDEVGVTELAETLDISKSAVHRHLTTLVNQDRVVNVDGYYRSVSQGAHGIEPTVDVIEALNEMKTATPEEIAAETSHSSVTVAAYLDKLEQAKYVVKRDNQYQNGLKFLDIGERVKYNTGIFDIVAEELDKLAAESGELALFSVMEHGQNVLLYKAHGDEAIRTSHETGLREPMHCSGLGKSILAELPDERVRVIVERHGLEQYTEHTITDLDELLAELDETRERGYAVDLEEAKPGMRCIAASVTSENSPLYGSVSVAAPKSRMQGERFEHQIPELVKGTANVIELNSIYVE
ncbi:transcriptional regulator, IclR family [Halogranum amylolyticum]|uniref:Transcriptional regulator, IclR family n=1 Tax=Halogranum amylolyticum TaxID=660520 RepID=A0A1H8TFK7_9EURY|nr:IclR family transcriptional regulator C-terminal domain-containing protein [Halogranum amylolyticum]SEO89870.1 transcriptional regulator, IclR family [Halogranum amylolyticum]